MSIRTVGIISGSHCKISVQIRSHIIKIKCLHYRFILIYINIYDLICQSLHHKTQSAMRSYMSCSDNYNFPIFYCFHFSFLRPFPGSVNMLFILALLVLPVNRVRSVFFFREPQKAPQLSLKSFPSFKNLENGFFRSTFFGVEYSFFCTSHTIYHMKFTMNIVLIDRFYSINCVSHTIMIKYIYTLINIYQEDHTYGN